MTKSVKESKATALKYDGKNTPIIVAKGSGILAEKIIDSAKKHDVHIHSDPILLAVLSRLELGDEIPQALYLAVAKIIAFAYFLQGKHPDNQAKKTPSVVVKQLRIENSESKDIKSN